MRRSSFLLALAGVVAVERAHAAGDEPATDAARAPAAEAASPSAAPVDAPPAAGEGSPYFRPYQLEVGLSLGGLFLAADHNLHEEPLPHQAYAPAFTLGERVGFIFSPYGGLEAEGLLGFTRSDDERGATAAGLRMHAIAELPLDRFAPFVVIGGGTLGVLSDSLGNDLDPAFHFGVGLKVGVTPRAILRLDLRDNLTQRNDAELGQQTHHPEFALSVALPVRFGGAGDGRAPGGDRDGDGVADGCDQCPEVRGTTPNGCAAADADGDGVEDGADRCPDESGLAPEGCPVDPDPDDDGFRGETDDCPDEAGPAPAGCPARDGDGDGIQDATDRCPAEAETSNGIEDEDGCPDTVPPEVQSIAGVLRGIEFDVGKATIRPESTAVLDATLKVLTDHPAVRIRVIGHTDNVGSRETNLALSTQRAEAVKQYLTGKGVEPGRVEAVGRGPDQPLVGNDSETDRQKNRRIEIELAK